MDQLASATLNFLNNSENRHWCEQNGRLWPRERHYRLVPALGEHVETAAFSQLADRLQRDGARMLMLTGRPEPYRLNARFTYILIFDLFNLQTSVSETGILLILEYVTDFPALPPLIDVFLNHAFYGRVVRTFWRKLENDLWGHPDPPNPTPKSGRTLLNIGPDHAGIIPPAQFQFTPSGEEIDQLILKMGYTHKQLATQFSQHTLTQGVTLAGFIDADHAVAFATAYCRAVESLANLLPPPPANFMRVILLELERMHNHLHTLAGLVEHTSNPTAADFFWQEEEIRRLCGQLFGDRLLRHQVSVGGVKAEMTVQRLRHIHAVVARIVRAATSLGEHLYHTPHLRERLINCGTLTPRHALNTGTTGLAWRATAAKFTEAGSDNIYPDYLADFRLRYPAPGYKIEAIQRILQQYFTRNRNSAFSQYNYRGDCFSRFLLRIEEIGMSGKIIETVTHHLSPLLTAAGPLALDFNEVQLRLRQAPPFSLGLAVVESTIGPVCCLVMKDSNEYIEFFALTDPSLLNWEGLRAASIHPTNSGTPESGSAFSENLLGDFPLINKSFDLSYSARDL